jgi:tetratricopeptide (TPR) repeat protein
MSIATPVFSSHVWTQALVSMASGLGIAQPIGKEARRFRCGLTQFLDTIRHIPEDGVSLSTEDRDALEAFSKNPHPSARVFLALANVLDNTLLREIFLRNQSKAAALFKVPGAIFNAFPATSVGLLEESSETTSSSQRISLNESLKKAFAERRYAQMTEMGYELLELEKKELGASRHQTLWRIGFAFYKLGFYEKAVTFLKEVVEKSPEPHYWCVLGKAYKKLRLFREAEESFREALALKPRSAVYLTELGDTLRSLRRYEEAKILLRQAVAIQEDRKPAIALRSLAKTLRHLGELDEAEQIILQAIRCESPPHVSSLKEYGIILREQGRLARSERVLRDALSGASDYPSSYLCELAVTLRLRGKYDESLNLLWRSTQTREGRNHPNNHFQMGITLRLIGRPRDSEDALREAIRLQPNQPQYHEQLYFTLRELDRSKEAVSALETAVRLYEEREHCLALEAVTHLAKHYRENGDVAHARDVLRSVVKKLEDKNVLYPLGILAYLRSCLDPNGCIPLEVLLALRFPESSGSPEFPNFNDELGQRWKKLTHLICARRPVDAWLASLEEMEARNKRLILTDPSLAGLVKLGLIWSGSLRASISTASSSPRPSDNKPRSDTSSTKVKPARKGSGRK